jgi:hypothetical protein
MEEGASTSAKSIWQISVYICFPYGFVSWINTARVVIHLRRAVLVPTSSYPSKLNISVGIVISSDVWFVSLDHGYMWTDIMMYHSRRTRFGLNAKRCLLRVYLWPSFFSLRRGTGLYSSIFVLEIPYAHMTKNCVSDCFIPFAWFLIVFSNNCVCVADKKALQSTYVAYIG